MADGINIYTELGLSKIRTAATSGTNVKITSIGLGDGAGAGYDPSSEQTALRGEMMRVLIETSLPVDEFSYRVTANVPLGAEIFDVRERGFFDEDGDLIALWAGLDVTPRPVGVVEYKIDHVLTFKGVIGGVLIVDAPLDVHIEFAARMLAEMASVRRREMNFYQQYRREHGHYIGVKS